MTDYAFLNVAAAQALRNASELDASRPDAQRLIQGMIQKLLSGIDPSRLSPVLQQSVRIMAESLGASLTSTKKGPDLDKRNVVEIKEGGRRPFGGPNNPKYNNPSLKL